MSVNKRYSLLVDLGNDVRLIKFSEYDVKKKEIEQKEKVDLSTIDFFTTSFENEQDLKEYLDVPEYGSIRIIYVSNKSIKELPLVYSDNLLARHFANLSINSSNLKEKDDCFYSFLNQMLRIIGFASLKKAFLENKDINLYLKTKIIEYIETPKTDMFLLQKIEKELENYKNLRSLLLCIQKFEYMLGLKLLYVQAPIYENVLPKKEVEISHFIPSEEVEEPLFPPNSEEEQAYQSYIENLPNEYSCHEQGIQYQLSKNKKRRH